MPRVKRGVISLKRRRNVLRKTKGYRFARSKKERAARDAIVHAGSYSFSHRKDKKGDFRRLWNIKLGAELKGKQTSYSSFMGALKKRGINLNRKMLSEIAENHPESFDRLFHKVAL